MLFLIKYSICLFRRLTVIIKKIKCSAKELINMTDIKIETGIPLPEKKNSMKGLNEPLKKLQVGDSFLWPSLTGSGIAGYASSLGIKVITRKQEGGVRIWRVE